MEKTEKKLRDNEKLYRQLKKQIDKEESDRKYSLHVCRNTVSSLFNPDIRPSMCFNQLGRFNTIGDCKRVASIGKYNNYYITNELTQKEVFVSLTVQFERDRYETEKEAENNTKKQIVKKLNKLPRLLKLKTLVPHMVFKISRSEFRYDPSYSAKIQGGYNLTYKMTQWPDTREDLLTLDNFISRDRKVLHKKFKDWVTLPVDCKLTHKELFKALQDKMNEVENKVREIKKAG